VGLVLTYIIVNSHRRKSKCPNCNKTNAVQRSWYSKDNDNQVQLDGEVNITNGFVTGILAIVYGVGISLVMIYMLQGAFEGTIGGLIWYIALLISGIYATVNGAKILSRTARSKGKEMTCCYKCGSCGNEWTEVNIIAK
jgi:hypothetical protein